MKHAHRSAAPRFAIPRTVRWLFISAFLLCLCANPTTALAAPDQPENVFCRPHGDAPEKVSVD